MQEWHTDSLTKLSSTANRGRFNSRRTPRMTAAPAPIPPADLPDPMRRSVQIIFGLYMMAIQVLIVYLLIKVWPDQIPPADRPEEVVAFFGRLHFTISLE